MTGTTLALIGATGGAGTTRLAVEFAGTLARAGRDVAVIDAAFETQGLRRYVDERPNPDLTAALLEEHPPGSAFLSPDLQVPGSMSVAPASAPFERLARAKTAGAARALEGEIGAAARDQDVVLVDTPPLAANQAVAAVSAADRVAIVAPDTPRGRDGLALCRGRVRDVGDSVDAVFGTQLGGRVHEGDGLQAPHATVPPLPGGPGRSPTTVDPTAPGAEAVAAALEPALDIQIEPPTDSGSALGGFLPGN
ncbi:MAG: ParA family protein [Haloarculaceae archaeon]